MTKQGVQFENPQGHLLGGDIYWPAGAPEAFVLFAHCFTCTAEIKAAVILARALTQQGLAVLSFDFTGLGASEGEFADSNFSTNISDLIAAADFLRDQYQAPAVLVGHSLGGTAVLAAAPAIPECKAVASIGAPARAAHVAHLLGSKRQAIDEDGEAEVSIGARPFLIKKQFLDDIERQPIPDNLGKLRRALLILHSPRDAIVSVDNAAEIFSHALHPKSFVSLDPADHLLSKDEDAGYAATIIAAWARRYIDAGPRAAESSEANDDAVVARTGNQGFVTEISAGKHMLSADEPASVGGSDLGPTPYGLLSAALASCTTMTLQMYARHKGIELDQAIVSVRHDRVHAEDCKNCESGSARIDRFDTELTLIGALNDAQRLRLAEIAEKCPVHRTLKNDVQIVTRLADHVD